MTTDIALRFKLSDFLAEYEEKKATLPDRLKAFEDAGDALKMACAVHGTYGNGRIEVGSNSLDELYKNLTRSALLRQALRQACRARPEVPEARRRTLCGAAGDGQDGPRGDRQDAAQV